MRKFRIIFPAILIAIQPGLLSQEGLIIQENTIGVCTMDGIVESSASGYTGEGYANINDGIGIGMSWSFSVSDSGIYVFYWRYALGGSDLTSRDAKLMVNNVYTSDTVNFPHSGSSQWSVWVTTDTIQAILRAGQNSIRLVSITQKGLPNIDYFHIFGNDINPLPCVPSYTFEISTNDSVAGFVDYFPVQEIYDQGTEITCLATSNPGYFFHSWSGEAASTDSLHTFAIETNTRMTALFYSDGTTMEQNAIGYATVQHDNGTPYLLTGGSLGGIVQANTLEDLQFFLSADTPYVVELSEHIQGLNTDEIIIRSNKTLIGTSDSAHIEGIGVKINEARNVIIRNITFSKVIQFDEIEINGASRNIWIDQCDFFTDLDNDVDYYDGLLDIKNQSTFITVSWSRFHDHQKCILISSGDQEFADSVIRITFHHNYFYNCNSRLPSIRFGMAHIFNNLYYNTGTAINSRMNACVRVEKNYFKDAGTGVGMLYSPIPGEVELIHNIFEDTDYSDSPSCSLNVPYEYSSFLNNSESIPDIIPTGTGGPQIPSILTELSKSPEVSVFPNPTSGRVSINVSELQNLPVTFSVYDMLGMKKDYDFNSLSANPGLYSLDLSILPAGMYMLQIQIKDYIAMKKIIIE